MSEEPILPPGFIEAVEDMQGVEGIAADLVPPVFYEMRGRILEFNFEERTLSARFPVMDRYQNPYGTMQGGMIAAAIDNTLGPLSQLVAPPNVTRNFEIKFKHPVTSEHEYIIVKAKVEEMDSSFLTLSARVRNNEEELVAIARARHYILPKVVE
jgi:acyl-coenzyme A thioesterase PaaI-like protein